MTSITPSIRKLLTSGALSSAALLTFVGLQMLVRFVDPALFGLALAVSLPVAILAAVHLLFLSARDESERRSRQRE